MVKAEQGGVMKVESMVSNKDGRPLVVFTWGEKRGELTTIQARGICLQMLEAAEAGTQDAALYQAILANEGTEDQAFAMIGAVRHFREQFDEESPEPPIVKKGRFDGDEA
jgi:hypothetical protein